MAGHLAGSEPGLVMTVRAAGDASAVARPEAQEVVVKLNVNGADVEVDDRFAASPLLWVLRDVLGLHGTKYGCGIGYCAACTVLIDGRNTKSCQTPAGRAIGKAVTTVEGASGPVVDAVRDGVVPGQRGPVRVLPARADAGRDRAAGG